LVYQIFPIDPDFRRSCDPGTYYMVFALLTFTIFVVACCGIAGIHYKIAEKYNKIKPGKHVISFFTCHLCAYSLYSIYLNTYT